jgi:hypothetical protein
MNGLSISRGDDLTPEQPTIDENIAKANEMLDKYGDELDREELPMWLTNLIIKIFQGDDNFMDKIILQVLKTIIEDTDIDDKLYGKVADEVKQQIPGEEFEPVIGLVLEALGKELQTPHKQ